MEQKQSIQGFKGHARLPNFAIPKRYDLHLKLDLSSACAFSGVVEIHVSIVEETKFLILNVVELDVHEVLFTSSHGQLYRPCDVVLDGDDESLVLVFDQALGVGEGVLGIEFSAVLNAHLKGFYKCTYTDGGEKKNMAVTQFEPVDARRCFPCWDEPALKLYRPCDVVLDGDDESLVLVFDQALGVGEGVLGIEFSAVLNAHLKGFYKCTYTDGGEKKNMAVTQFEPVDARRCFPCWDEPALKLYRPCDVVLDGDDESLVLVFDQALGVGEGVLGIEFSAVLNAHLKGFYKCTYTDGGEKKNMAVTQFEPVDARRCFPCWDEPALKATFKIAVDVPPELTALSNMPIINEKLDANVKTVCFEESPIMSTYLVAVVVGVFDYIEDTTSDGVLVRAYCPVGKSDKGEFALNVAVKTLDLFSKYFSTPYPLPKLDMVAVPEFSGGAMENYGLITYRENELLYDPLHSTTARKQSMAIVVAHEVAHQWFGNLVTMEWWSDLWLNEGFATWVSYLATDILFPEWKIWAQFLQQTTGGLIKDALEQSHPIQVEIDHARSILEVFDDISYKKGSAVIRMLQGYLGDDIFQKSLSSYIKRFSGKNAKTEDLWSVLSEESGIKVGEMMDGWTKEKGYPVISVKAKEHILEFEQAQFLSSGLHGDGKWIIPITFSLGSYERRRNFLLETKSREVNILDLVDSSDNDLKDKEKYDEQLWVKVNIKQSGFYRVNYEDKLAARLRKAIEHNSLEATDKFGILDDAYALCETCEQSLSSLLSLMDAYRKEEEYIVVTKLIDVCYNVINISSEAIPDSAKELKKFFISLLLFPAEKLGWESVPGESHFSALLRAEILQALVTFGHDKTQKDALDRFQTLLNDRNTPLLSADTRGAAYIAVMRNSSSSNREGFESLLKFYREANTVQEKERILRFFASSLDPDTVLEVLNFFLSKEVRDQDIIYGLFGISSECRETAWRWLKENWDLILTKYGAGLLLTHFVRDIVTPLCSNEKADEVEEFFASRVHPAISMTLEQSIAQVRIKARWVEHMRQEQSLERQVRELAGKK